MAEWKPFRLRQRTAHVLSIDNGVKYGDLTGDGREEAVVVLWIVTSGTARDGVVFVYTLSTGRPKRLFAFETGDRWDYGYHNAFINNGELIVERYKPYMPFTTGRSTICRRPAFIFATITNGRVAAFAKQNLRWFPWTQTIALHGHTAYNKSLDASGGSVFLNLLGTAQGALIRAAASTQPLDGYSLNRLLIDSEQDLP